MKLIVGLGNPGQEYSTTKHNVGFMAIDELARRWEVSGWKSRMDALIAEYRGDEPILLVKPQTFMNLSGTAVGALARWHKIAAKDILVIYDDLDLPVGKLRLRGKGGSGGHRGIESLLVHLGHDDFVRIRVGIGRPPQGWETADYVLSRFSKEEEPLVAAAIKRSLDAVECVLKSGLAKAMNEYSK